MNLATIRAQLEQELAWRTEEINFFHNACASIKDEAEREKFRRAIVLLLYANFEGFCKFALSLYVDAINGENLDCEAANFALVAASLADVFATLRDGIRRAKEFRNKAPDDRKLHRFALDREFVERATELMCRKVAIPDGVVDTESNLTPVVLRKNLFRLGLPYESFSSLDPDIHRLLLCRNRIAHGETKDGIDVKEYEQLKKSALHIMNEIVRGITKAVSEGFHLRIHA